MIGSYGSPPTPVIDAMRAISDECEKCPDLFMRRTYMPLMEQVREQLAEMVNADVDDCVLVCSCAEVEESVLICGVGWECDVGS